MNRLTLILPALLLIILVGCRVGQSAAIDIDVSKSPTPSGEVSESPIPSSEIKYISETSVEDCYLCNGDIENISPLYWGQNNIAFISLNTFEIVPIKINRYDEISGKPIEEYLGAFSFGGGNATGNGFSTAYFLDCDRGYAHGELEFHNDENLDMDKISSFLCTNCLNKVVEHEPELCFGVGIIDLKTKNLSALEKRYMGLSMGDYCIYFDTQTKRRDESLLINFLAFYAPIRYEKPQQNK